MKILFLSATAIFCGVLMSNFVYAQTEKRQADQPRYVKNRVLTSTALPPVRLKFDKALKYAGSQNFTLYGRAQAEQFYFVEADGQQRIKRMFIVQFEGFLPSNNQTYNYPATKTVNLGGQNYIVDASMTPDVAAVLKKNPETDAAQAASFLERKGFGVGRDVLFQRFIRVVDEAKRNEFILIYIEDLSGTGLTAADLSKGGRAENQKDKIFEELQKRALSSFKVLK